MKRQSITRVDAFVFDKGCVGLNNNSKGLEKKEEGAC